MNLFKLGRVPQYFAIVRRKLRHIRAAKAGDRNGEKQANANMFRAHRAS